MNVILQAILAAIVKAGGALLLAIATESFAKKIVKIIALWALDTLDAYADKTDTPIDDQLIQALRNEVATKIEG